MERMQRMGRWSITQSSIALIALAGIALASWTVLAREQPAVARRMLPDATLSQTTARLLAADHDRRQPRATAPHAGRVAQASTATLVAEQQVDYRVQKRWDIVDRLQQQAESAWQAGEFRAAVAFSRQSWAVIPGFPRLDAAGEKRWEIADRLQREGNAAWQAGDVRHAASLYHQSQRVLPW